MVRLVGPLHSNTASGSLGNALTFTSHKGRAVARVKKKPAQPVSINRQQAQNMFRVAGYCIRWLTQAHATETSPGAAWHNFLTANNPPNLGPQGWLTKALIGDNGNNWKAAEALTISWGDAEYEQWDAYAASLNPPIVDVALKGSLFNYDGVIAAGMVYFHLWRAMVTLGA